ncbi:MAG: hypothetical protein DBX97_03075 [Collinsella tanakaei]|nr:MAG: hypothetical protein DBX97_03075 [Collinsella tanakaei]
MENNAKSRNNTVDILRGIAMLMVVLGHTMTGCAMNSEQSFLFNVVWTLQMPLFMLISGYVTKYSKPITSAKSWGKFIGKRTLAYLLPWLVWTIVIRGIIFQQKNFLDIKFLIYHMDAGYWFLFTIWTVVMVFGIAQFISEKIASRKNKYVKMIVLTAIYVLGMCAVGGVGFIMGFSFLCIKLTLYYMPFYFVGYLFGQLQSEIEKIKFGRQIIDGCIAVCLVVWIALMLRYNFYAIGNSAFGIILRAVASLSGCIAICGLVSGIVNNVKIQGVFIQYVGVHSLEIYTIHGLLLSMIKPVELPAFLSMEGMVLIILNFMLTVGVSIAVIALLNQSKVLKIILFGKRS